MTDLRSVSAEQLQDEVRRRVRLAEAVETGKMPWSVRIGVEDANRGRAVELIDLDGTVWDRWEIRASETLTIRGLFSEVRVFST